MSSFLEKMHILQPEDADVQPIPAAKPDPITQEHAAATSTSSAAPDVASETQITEKLAQALEENALPGIDFLKFRKSLKAMSQVLSGVDERTLYCAAFATLNAQGANAGEIVNSVKHYTDLLATKEGAFKAFLAQQVAAKVTAQTDQAATIADQIKAKSEQITKLTEEIGTLTGQAVDAKNSAANAKAELDTYSASFQDAKARMETEILSIQDKITTYILNTTKGA